MLSTTDRRPERGQVVVIFALSLTTLILVAALAFDTGSMLLGRRDQQNASDAAALAGARYLPGSSVQAEAAARAIATENGFTDGSGSQEVVVNIPPTTGEFANLAGFIEVQIADTRPSIFGGIMGVAGWDVGARAVAANQEGIPLPFAMLALDPTGCRALSVTGGGSVIANGNIQVNSDCTNGALFRQGGGVITVTAPNAACNVVGDVAGDRPTGDGSLNCVVNEGAPLVIDPLLNLPEPPVPELAATPILESIGTEVPPTGCPGSDAPATAADPDLCHFNSSYAGTTWRIFPGYYPGGMHLQAGTFYLEPGIYYIGGGGLQINGNGVEATSVATGGTTLGGGLMIFNSDHPDLAAEPVYLNGASSQVNVYPLDDGSFWDGIVIYQDRDVSINGDDVTINGGDSTMQVRGTIYVPAGDVKVNGSSGTIIVDQVIAYTFQITGNGGTIRVEYDPDFIFTLKAAGLVE